MALTSTKIKNAKAKLKLYKLYDEKGLYLEITPKGGKRWRLKYRFNNKEKRISLGVYPEISLKDARDRRDENRKLLANDIDPSEYRKTQKSANLDAQENSFEAVALEWHEKQKSTWTPDHAKRLLRRLSNDIFPWIGSLPIADIKAPALLNVVRKIESRGANESAHRALSNCGQIFRYAVATGKAERDPSGDLKGALEPVIKKHFAAVTEPKDVGKMLYILDGYQGSLVVRTALRFAPLVFVRPGELRKAEWKDIDFEKSEWRYLVTKTDTQHIVPLSKQAIALLEEIKPLTGKGRYVFPGARSRLKPMSDNAILAALRGLGIPKEEMSGHGFRAMARTILDEVLDIRPDYIEHQLAHAVRDPNGRAYNRTAHLVERRKMMQTWADYLDKLKIGADIIPIQSQY